MRLVAFAWMAIVAATLALADSTYDWRSGTTYNFNTDNFRNTRIRGYNFNTGSTWNTTIQPNGNMRGIDSDGNYWNYNSGSRPIGIVMARSVPVAEPSEPATDGPRYLLAMATGKKDGHREAELEAAIEKIKQETWKTGQTLPKLRHAIALALQELKHS